jgi:hypothetical protein
VALALLTLNEVAELEGKSYHAVYRQVERKKLEAIKVPSENRKGFEYRVSLRELSEKAQAKYYARLKATEQALDVEEKPNKYEDMTIEDLTAEQRQEIAYWKKVLEDWRRFIAPYKKQKTLKTKEFIKIHNIQNPHKSIKERTLRDKWQKYRQYGEIALADHRSNSKTKGKTSIDEIVWSVFLQWWLDENQPSLMHVYRLTKAWAELEMPQLLPLPSPDTFYRAVNKIPAGVVKYFREGDKVLTDEVLPYIVRTYEYLDSNDIWSSDYHTLDIMVRDDVTGKVYRPHVVVWMDIRSRKLLSMRLCETSNSDGVILSFRDAVKRFGIPKQVYLDNGKEYLVRDFGGRGKRKTDTNADYGSTILERLGIEMHNAKVRNARAKVVERAFKQVSGEFSKLIITYCGNRPENRPERHNKILKNTDNIPLASKVKEDLWIYFEGWYNTRKSQAEGLNGLSPNECYAQNLIVKRTATEEQLNLMLLRNARLQKVDRNGVYITIGEKKLWFYSEELVHHYFKQEVYVRYDSEDLTSVRVYDSEERYLDTAYLLEKGGYEGTIDKETIKKMNKRVKKQKELIKGYMNKQVSIYQAPEAMEILLRKAKANMEADTTEYEAGVIHPISFNSKPKLAVAVGETELIDFNRMIENARKKKEEE